MSKPAIVVEGLSKSYRIGRRDGCYRTFREALIDAVKMPFRRLRQLGRDEMAADETFWALRDVNFDVQAGEVVGIIGRNGAGKSTLLKVLSRITEPTAGQITLRGRVASLLEVGTGFHPELTGRENIYLSGGILGMRKAEIDRRFDEIVAFAEIEKFLDTPVKRYSSGMYVRLAFAVAAHLDPEILLVDEVLAVGDAAFQKKCLGKMDEVARGGRTVLFVSHNMDAIQRLCSSAVLLAAGRVETRGHHVGDITRAYLFGGQGAGECVWENSGQEYMNPWFKPLRFGITDERGAPASQVFANDDDRWIAMEVDIKALDPGLTMGYAIYGDDGQLLYWSYHTDEKAEKWPRLEIGRQTLRSKFPRRLLNAGKYRIEMISCLHCQEWIIRPGVNAPSISIAIQGGLSDSPHWMNERPGLLAPVLGWTSERA